MASDSKIYQLRKKYIGKNNMFLGKCSYDNGSPPFLSRKYRNTSKAVLLKMESNMSAMVMPTAGVDTSRMVFPKLDKGKLVNERYDNNLEASIFKNYLKFKGDLSDSTASTTSYQSPPHPSTTKRGRGRPRKDPLKTEKEKYVSRHIPKEKLKIHNSDYDYSGDTDDY